jgi:hypothetical protein
MIHRGLVPLTIEAHRLSDRMSNLAINLALAREEPNTVTPDDWRWRHFPRKELECHCGCGLMNFDAIAPEFLDNLEFMRIVLGEPMPVNSGCRCAAHDKEVGGKGWHTTGAADIGAAYAKAARFLRIAILVWPGGIGIHQHGPPAERFIHFDKGPFRIWTYPERS